MQIFRGVLDINMFKYKCYSFFVFQPLKNVKPFLALQSYRERLRSVFGCGPKPLTECIICRKDRYETFHETFISVIPVYVYDRNKSFMKCFISILSACDG